MKVHPLLCFLVLAGLNTGCSFFCYSIQNLVESPAKAIDDCLARHRFAAMARDAWRHTREADPDQYYSDDYATGFIDGYVDFLDAGGTGEPPAAPPDRYLHSHYETPAGQQAILDWFAGFRHGAAAARASGQRDLVVVPISLPPRSNIGVRPIPTSTESQPTAPVQVPQEELLPPPRKIQPEPGPKGF
jgi:hypothetical protein